MNKKRICRIVAGFLCLSTLLCGCVGFDGAGTSDPSQGGPGMNNTTGSTEQTLQTAPNGETVIPTPTGEDAPTDPQIVMLSLGWNEAYTNKKVVTVTVSSEAVNDVKAGIFGANVSWRGDGYGQWDSRENAPDETLLAQLKNSGVTHLRYPGGIEGDYFHWNESIGDVRIPQIDPFSKDYPTYETYDGERFIATFGPDEFLELCKAAGDGVTIQLNAGNGTAKEAADWVRYYKEKGADIWSFCVGNEVCMAEERVAGMKVTCTPQEYVDFYNQVWKELDGAADDIEFGAIGITPSHPLCKYRNWDSTILSQLGDKIDFIDVHIGYSPYFVSGETQKDIVKCLMSSSQFVRFLLNQEIALINDCATEYADDISIQITEWGPIGGYSASVAGSVYMASFLNTVIAEPKVTSACYLPLINHYAAANLLGALVDKSVTGKQVYWDNCNSFVFRWYSEQVGRDVLTTGVSGGDTFDSIAIGLMPEQKDVGVGEASVYYDPATKTGTVFLINKSYNENTRFQVQLPFGNVTLTNITELWNESCVAQNDYSNPNAVKPASYVAGQVSADGSMTVDVKPVSLLKIDFTVSD